MISTLLFTIVVEGLVVLGYCQWRAKPVRPILFTSTGLNILTQAFLWLVLNIFFQFYIPALLTAEIIIWVVESIGLYAVSANQMRWLDSMLLSLSMNLASFGLGWFLPL